MRRNTVKNCRKFGTLLNLFESSKMPRVSLDVAMVPEPEKAATSVVPAKAPAITTLPNGVRVVSLDDNSAVSAVGVLVETGIRYEDESTIGASVALERLALGSSKSHTSVTMNRSVSRLGAHLIPSVSREMITYQSELLRDDVPAMLEIMSEAVVNPALNSWEIDDVKSKLYEESEMRKGVVDEIAITDFAHAAAFKGNALSLPTSPTKHIIDLITPEGVQAFYQSQYTAKNTVVACVGIEHEEFVGAVDKYFSGLTGEKTVPVSAKYTGGDVRPYGFGEDGMVHVALSFESITWSDKALAAASVLQMMMGGGGSFSAGGPGKGMYTRLYENVLNQYGFVQSATCTQSVYNDTGLFTLYGIAPPQFSNQLVSVLVDQATRMAGPISPTELSRAKNLLKSFVLMHLESRLLLQDDIGRAVITFNKVKSPQALCAEIDAVTAEDIQAVARKMLSSPLSLAAVGEVGTIPERDMVARQISA
eukprot:CAMPEP_0167758378 /NCGR_PEP_ID=MMETSP0110_2-20121227/10435_1 /TAXON_ID=629695 /ORGANISM="Gymnochlora sp., Strain CCMP2014" /LENGTH=477 /DNA_ID=CAMNT_0007644647 /DNA_START=44 /DNA_END=1477 /DNA_ORIENTATION=+